MKDILTIGFAAKKYIQEQSSKWKKSSKSSIIAGNPKEGYIQKKQIKISDNDPKTDDIKQSSVKKLDPEEDNTDIGDDYYDDEFDNDDDEENDKYFNSVKHLISQRIPKDTDDQNSSR